MSLLSARWVLYAAGGDRIAEAPEPLDFEASVPWCDAGSHRLTYSVLSAQGPLFDRPLTAGTEVALEVCDGGAWVEPDGARFLVLDRDTDMLDDQQVRVVSGPSYLWLASKIRSLNTAVLNPADHTEAGKRPFLTATPGQIAATLLTEAAADGMDPFTWDFTPTHDSNGDPWAQVVSWHVNHGITLDVLIQQLVAVGACEVTTRGRELVLTNPDGLSLDLAATVRYDAETHMVAAPGTETIADLASRFHFSGGEGLHESWTAVSAPTPWGAWQWHDSNDSITDPGTAQALLQETAKGSGRMRGQYVRDLTNPGPDVWPLLDYAPGAWITAPTNVDAERVRLVEVIVRAGEAGEVVPSLVLNDRLLDETERQARRRAGIVGGSSNPGGSDVRPNPGGPDKRKPAAPTGLVATSEPYVTTDGSAATAVRLECAAVTTARPEDGGGLIDVAAYNWYRRRTDTLFTDTFGQITQTAGPEADHSPYEPGSVWEFAVQAVSADGVPGVLSDPVSVTMATFVEPPPTPSTPTITTDKGLAFGVWDGLTADGTPMPGHFRRVRFHVSTSMVTPAIDATTIGSRATAGRELLPPEPYGTTRYLRLQAEGIGGRSAWSAPVAFETTLIEGAHLGVVVLTATGEIQAVEPDGRVTRMRGGDGLQHLMPFADDHGGTALEVVSQFGRDFTQYDGTTGSILAQIMDGQASFSGLSTADNPAFMGRPYFSRGPDGLLLPDATDSWEWERTWGTVPGGYADMKPWLPSSFTAGVTYGVGQVEVEMLAGRTYQVQVSSSPVDLQPSSSVVGSVTGYFFYRFTTDGTEPADPVPRDTASTGGGNYQMIDSQVWTPLSSSSIRWGVNPATTAFFDPGSNRRMKILFAIRCLYADGVPGGTFSGATWRMLVTDAGPQVVSTGKQNNSTYGKPTDDAPPAGGTKRTYTTRWYGTERHNWQGSVEYNGYSPGGQWVGQGWLSSFSAGPRRGYLGFLGGAASSSASSEVGKTIGQALSGATNIKATAGVGLINSVNSSVPVIVGTAASNGGAVTTRKTQTIRRGSLARVGLDIGSWLQASSSNRWLTFGPGTQTHATYHGDMAWRSADPAALRTYLEVQYTR